MITTAAELKNPQAIALAAEFVQQEFIQRGMIADLNIFLGGHNPYTNAMLTMREVTATGFGRKVREWNQASLLREWREHWADIANEHLRRAGHEAGSIIAASLAKPKRCIWAKPPVQCSARPEARAAAAAGATQGGPPAGVEQTRSNAETA